MCEYGVCCVGCGTIERIDTVLNIELFEKFDDAYAFALDDARNLRRHYLNNKHSCHIDITAAAIVLYLENEPYYKWQVLCPTKRKSRN